MDRGAKEAGHILESPATALFEAVSQAGQLRVVPRPLDELLHTMLELLERSIPPGRILLLLRDDPSGDPLVRAARPLVPASREDILLSRTIVDTAMEERTSLLVTDVAADERFQRAESILSLSRRSTMAAPLSDNERVIGLVSADTSHPGVHYERDELAAFTVLANLIAVKITNTRLLEEQRKKERMEQEMETAARIQRTLLPAHLPEVEGYELLARQLPCWETAGDLYDAMLLADGSLAIALGDVSGKGAGTALLMSHVMALLRVRFETDVALAEICQRLNRRIVESSDPMSFVTICVGRLSPREHVFEYVNAGHHPPVLIAPGGRALELSSCGFPIGLMPATTYTTASLAFDPGALLCLYSDGIPEAQAGEEFYEDERFLASLAKRVDRPLEEIAAGVLEDLRAFRGTRPPGDDITLMLLRRATA